VCMSGMLAGSTCGSSEGEDVGEVSAIWYLKDRVDSNTCMGTVVTHEHTGEASACG
jgi:hypothetical protein